MKTLIPWLLVAVGGSLGAMARFGLSKAILSLGETRFPWATFAVNMLGCFALGFVGTLVKERHPTWPDFWRYAVATGFLGSFTTFSTFELETHCLLEDSAWLLAAAYAAGSVFAGLVSARLGVLAARRG